MLDFVRDVGPKVKKVKTIMNWVLARIGPLSLTFHSNQTKESKSHLPSFQPY